MPLTMRQHDANLHQPALCELLPIRVVHQDLWTSLSLEALARKRQLAAYDASYLDLAQRLVNAFA